MHYAFYSCDRSGMATACSSSAASGKKRKKVVLTIEEKLKICDLVKNGRSLTSVVAELNVGKSTVHYMVKNKAKLQTFLTEIQDADCIKMKGYLWFVQQRWNPDQWSTTDG